MTIHLPEELESIVRAEVLSGQFASEDDMVATAVREYFAHHGSPRMGQAEPAADPLLGSLRQYSDEMDEVVDDAMKRRREEPWRVIPGE